jgi:hypothetical protein
MTAESNPSALETYMSLPTNAGSEPNPIERMMGGDDRGLGGDLGFLGAAAFAAQHPSLLDAAIRPAAPEVGPRPDVGVTPTV